MPTLAMQHIDFPCKYLNNNSFDLQMFARHHRCVHVSISMVLLGVHMHKFATLLCVCVCGFVCECEDKFGHGTFFRWVLRLRVWQPILMAALRTGLASDANPNTRRQYKVDCSDACRCDTSR